MKIILILSFFAGAVLPLAASEFPEPYDSEPGGASPPPAAEAAKLFDVPEGFQVTVFASEPEVRNPIAMAWDHRGRMWVAENYTYAERKKRFDLDLRDRVVVFEDTDHDGRADERTVFIDTVQMLTSVEVGRGGVWLMCPPQLLFVPDRDGDDVPDGEPEVLLDGFTVAKGNYHNFANGLRWGPDGWLYGRCGHSCPGRLGVPGTPDNERVPIDGGMWRYHPDRKVVEVLCHGTTNPWGHDWDRHGQAFFINTVNGHLWHLIPGAHFRERGGQSQNPQVFQRLQMHADHWHYDTTGSWQASRDGKANDYGGGHSHIGMVIYQADHLPESWRDRLFTWNQHGRRANRERLERHGSGYLARHEPDVLLTGDEWFRGLDLRTGPEGALYGLDWSDTGECHDHTGVHRSSGRIYRFTSGEPQRPDLAKLVDPSPAVVTDLLSHPNAWYERQLRKLHAERKVDPKLLVSLRELLESDLEPFVRLRALWLLNELEAANPVLLGRLLDDPSEHVRSWAIRLLTDRWPLDSIMGPMPHRSAPLDKELLARFDELARTDRSGLVRLTLASTLQRIPVEARGSLGRALAGHAEDSGDHNLPAMVWYGVNPLHASKPEALVRIAEATMWPDLLQWIARSLAGTIGERGEPVEAILALAASQPAKAPALLTGMNAAFEGRSKAPLPGNWKEVVGALQEVPEVADELRKLRALFGDDLAMKQLKALAFDDEAELAARERALETLIIQRPPELREICERLLETRGLNKTAVRGLAGFDDPAIGEKLARIYGTFRQEERRPVIDVLASRAGWAHALLEAIAADRIPREDLTPFHARQIAAHEDEELTAQLERVWGLVRSSDEAKRKRIEALKRSLTSESLAEANLGRGRVHYQTLCASCHKLYGEGGELGPDLTGSGRADLDYLLENIVDPSAVVSADYQLTTLALKDGRVLSGVVARADDHAVTLRILNDETTVALAEIEERAAVPVSIMPEGLLGTLEAEQIRDLIAYLQHPQQVPLPDEGQ